MTPTERIHLDFPATRRHLGLMGMCVHELLERLREEPEWETMIYNIQLAVHEVANNIVEHAYHDRGGRIRADFYLYALEQLVVEIFDEGDHFDPALVPSPNLEGLQERGYGLFLVRQLLDEVKYQAHSGGNHWRLVKNLN
jgi:serine/threonine-protein kinase RsbW